MREITDLQAVSRCLCGESAVFETLVERYKNQVFSLLLSVLQNQADAEDIAQETFIKAFRKLGQYNPDYSFATWLFKIAHNTALDFIRAKHPQLSLDDENNPIDLRDRAPSPDENLAHTFTKELLERELSLLPGIYREILLLRHNEHLDYEQLADVLGLSLSAAKTRLFRARELLKRNLLAANVETF
ncbi:MAG TPA: sigma-70 family RNA polymerase sigma factor [Elusimicrobiales bacterium]|nr:sigma-70 family RNA polymerase sigma factor [Elusimicrobiales bacterium]